MRGAGIRANCENSSTSPFSDSTSPTIVVVHSSTSACVAGGAPAKCRRSRSARQLNRRQRVLDLVRQPPRHFAPRRDLLRADQRRHVVEHEHRRLPARRRRRRARVATAARCSSWPSRAIAISCGAGSRRAVPRRASSAPSGCRSARSNTVGAGCPTIVGVEAEQPRRRAVDRGDRARRRRPTRRRSRCARGSSRCSAGGLRPRGACARARSVDRSSLRRLVASSPAIAVERLDERAELVVALRLDALIEVARADLARRRGQHLHRPRDPLGEVEAHPGRADQNHQRHHQEERQVDAGERPLQHAQLVVVLERLRHAARRAPPARRSDSRWRRRRPSALPVPRRIDGAAACIRSPPLPSGSIDARCRPARRAPAPRADRPTRAAYPRRQRRRRDVDDRHDAAAAPPAAARRGRPRPSATRCSVTSGATQIANGRHVGRCRDRPPPARARCAPRDRSTSTCRSLVVVAGDLVRRRQDLVHRRVEPAVDAVADQLAADDQHEHRRHERHAEQHARPAWRGTARTAARAAARRPA